MKQNGWLIIESLHLVSNAMLNNIFKSIKYAAKMQASQKQERQFCVWIISELGAPIPKDFVACLKKVSWHFLLNQSRKKSLKDDIYVDSLSRLLLSAMTSALAQTDKEMISRVKMTPPMIQRLYFGICVLHGLLQTQRIFPKTGLNHLTEMNYEHMHQALNIILSTHDKMKTCENNFYDVVVEGVNLIYAGLSQSSVDAGYIEALVHEIISGTLNHKDFLVINHLKIPVPPSTVDPEHYSVWLTDHMEAKHFKKDSFLIYIAEKEVANTYSSLFMRSLSAMYDSMQSSLPVIRDKHCDHVKQLAYLRANVEAVLEHLPSLIETDSLRTAQDQQNSNHVLLQECNWMNMTLKKIKDNVSALSRCFLGGLRTVPENLKDIAEALQNAEVPRSWLPSHSCQTPHNLSTWLEALHEKHKQLKQWLREGLLPFAKNDKEALTCISLGGLVNPEALLLALRTEFAVHHGYLLHEVVLQCHITEYLDSHPGRNIYSLYLKDLVLQGAAWDFQKKYLVETRDMITPLPYLVIIPTLLRSIKQSVADTEYYQCPVYSDYTMQSCLLKLNLLTTKPMDLWHLKKVAIFLNPDIVFTTPGAFLPPAMKILRNDIMLNSITKMDKLSCSRIFNIPRRRIDSLLVKAQAHKAPAISIDGEMFSMESITSETLLVDGANDCTSLQGNFETVLLPPVSLAKNSFTSNNYDDTFNRGDINDGQELESASGKSKDVTERRKDLVEGATFLEYHSEGAAETVNEPSINKHLMVHIRETDYEHSDNEHGPEDINGSFDKSKTEGYKEELDTWQGNAKEGLQDNNDYEGGENQAAFVYEQDNVGI